MNKQYEIRYETKLWTYDTESITDLPTDEQGMEKFKNDMKGILQDVINTIPGIKSYEFNKPTNNDIGLDILFVLSVESDDDVTDKLDEKINNYITDVSAYDYCSDLSEYENETDEDDEDESGWNLDEVTVELYINEV